MKRNLKLKMMILERVGTQCHVSIRTGIAESRLSQIVRGRRKPTAYEALLIANVLEITSSEMNLLLCDFDEVAE